MVIYLPGDMYMLYILTRGYVYVIYLPGDMYMVIYLPGDMYMVPLNISDAKRSMSEVMLMNLPIVGGTRLNFNIL